jgi:hypothetical protein
MSRVNVSFIGNKAKLQEVLVQGKASASSGGKVKAVVVTDRQTWYLKKTVLSWTIGAPTERLGEYYATGVARPDMGC